jgi:hypothetical protein
LGLNAGLCRFLDAQPSYLLEDYAKFLTLKVVCDDIASQALCPTFKVDKIWHAHILADISEYIQDCSYILIQFDPARWLKEYNI